MPLDEALQIIVPRPFRLIGIPPEELEIFDQIGFLNGATFPVLGDRTMRQPVPNQLQSFELGSETRKPDLSVKPMVAVIRLDAALDPSALFPSEIKQPGRFKVMFDNGRRRYDPKTSLLQLQSEEYFLAATQCSGA